MKIKELKEKTEVELQRSLAQLRDKIREMRFKHAAGQLKKVRDIRDAKKTIARILTLIAARREAKPAPKPKAKA